MRPMALLWRLLFVSGVVIWLMVARVAVVLLEFMAARIRALVGGWIVGGLLMVGGVLIVRVFVVVGGLVAVGGSLAVVVVARSLVVPRRRRSRSASAVNGVVTGWGRSRSNCLVLDNLAFGCRTVGHAGSLGAMRDGSIRKQAGAEEGERRRRREQAGAVQAGYAAGRCNHGSSNLGTSLASEARAFLIAMMMGTGQHFISNSHLRLRPLVHPCSPLD